MRRGSRLPSFALLALAAACGGCATLPRQPAVGVPAAETPKVKVDAPWHAEGKDPRQVEQMVQERQALVSRVLEEREQFGASRRAGDEGEHRSPSHAAASLELPTDQVHPHTSNFLSGGSAFGVEAPPARSGGMPYLATEFRATPTAADETAEETRFPVLESPARASAPSAAALGDLPILPSFNPVLWEAAVPEPAVPESSAVGPVGNGVVESSGGREANLARFAREPAGVEPPRTAAEGAWGIRLLGILVGRNQERVALVEIARRDSLRVREGEVIEVEEPGGVVPVRIVRIDESSIQVRVGDQSTLKTIR